MNFTPVKLLGAIAIVAIIGLVSLAFAPGQETQFIQNTLGSVALASVAAIAGLVRGAGEQPENKATVFVPRDEVEKQQEQAPPKPEKPLDQHFEGDKYPGKYHE